MSIETPLIHDPKVETLKEFEERISTMKRDLFNSIDDTQTRIKLQHMDMMLQRRLSKIKDPYTRANVVFHEMIAKSTELVRYIKGK
jgi:hypothetical protein